MSAALKALAGPTVSNDESEAVSGSRVGGSYSDFLINLDRSVSDESVLLLAANLAEQFEAHLEIMLANRVWSSAVHAVEGMAFVSELVQSERHERNATAARTKDSVERMGCRREFRRFDAHPDELDRIAASASRCVDLSIVARPGTRTRHLSGVLEAILFEGGGAGTSFHRSPPKGHLPRPWLSAGGTRPSAREPLPQPFPCSSTETVGSFGLSRPSQVQRHDRARPLRAGDADGTA